MTSLISIDWILDGGYLPLPILRQGVRYQLRDRKKIIATESLEHAYKRKMDYVDLLRQRPIAIETAAANEQHYEVGTGVLAACLGPRMKYSCCLYPKGNETLAEAEIAMLDSYIEKADLKDGQSILDLGYASHYHVFCNANRCKDVDGDLPLCTSLRSFQAQRSQLSRIPEPRRSILTSRPKRGD